MMSSSISNKPFLASYLVYENGSWRLADRFFPQKNAVEAFALEVILNNFHVNSHNGLIFKGENSVADEYLISVHEGLKDNSQSGQESEVIQVLTQDTSDFPLYRLDKRIVFSDAYKLKSGYIVLFQVRPKAQAELVYKADLFSPEGKFLKRIDLSMRPIPCINRDELFLVEDSPSGEYILDWLPFGEP